jgi:hypothetical protein
MVLCLSAYFAITITAVVSSDPGFLFASATMDANTMNDNQQTRHIYVFIKWRSRTCNCGKYLYILFLLQVNLFPVTSRLWWTVFNAILLG